MIERTFKVHKPQTVTHKRDRRVVMVIKYLKKEIKWTIIVYQKVKDYFFSEQQFCSTTFSQTRNRREEKRRKKKTQKKKQKTKKKPKQYI